MVQDFYILLLAEALSMKLKELENHHTQICFSRRYVFTLYSDTKIFCYERLLNEQAE